MKPTNIHFVYVTLATVFICTFLTFAANRKIHRMRMNERKQKTSIFLFSNIYIFFQKRRKAAFGRKYIDLIWGNFTFSFVLVAATGTVARAVLIKVRLYLQL